MPTATTGTSPFYDPTNVQWVSNSTTYKIFGVEKIDVSQNIQRILTKDNGATRYVASSVVFYEEKISITCNDANSIIQLQGAPLTGMGTLSFDYLAETQNIAATTLPNQEVTILNVVWDSASLAAAMKAEGKFSLTGTILGVSGGTAPISYASGA